MGFYYQKNVKIQPEKANLLIMERGNNRMKKRILTAALIFTLLLAVTGCGNKSEITISLGGIGDYEVTEIPSGLVNYSTDDDVIKITVEKNGNYDFKVKDEDGKEYSFTLKYENKKVEAQTDDDIAVNLGMK